MEKNVNYDTIKKTAERVNDIAHKFQELLLSINDKTNEVKNFINNIPTDRKKLP